MAKSKWTVNHTRFRGRRGQNETTASFSEYMTTNFSPYVHGYVPTQGRRIGDESVDQLTLENVFDASTKVKLKDRNMDEKFRFDINNDDVILEPIPKSDENDLRKEYTAKHVNKSARRVVADTETGTTYNKAESSRTAPSDKLFYNSSNAVKTPNLLHILDSQLYQEFKKDPEQFKKDGKLFKNVFTSRLLEEVILTPRDGLYVNIPKNIKLTSPYGCGKTGACIDYIIKHAHVGIVYVSDIKEEVHSRIVPTLREHGIKFSQFTSSMYTYEGIDYEEPPTDEEYWQSDVIIMDFAHYLCFDQSRDPHFSGSRWPIVLLDINVHPLVIPMLNADVEKRIDEHLSHEGLSYHVRTTSVPQSESTLEEYDVDINYNQRKLIDWITSDLTWDDLVGIESWTTQEGRQLYDQLTSVKMCGPYLQRENFLKTLAWSLSKKCAVMTTPPRKTAYTLCIHPVNIFHLHMYQANIWLTSDYSCDDVTRMFMPSMQQYVVGGDVFDGCNVGMIDVYKYSQNRWKNADITLASYTSGTTRLNPHPRKTLQLRDIRNDAIREERELKREDMPEASGNAWASIVTWRERWPSERISLFLDPLLQQFKDNKTRGASYSTMMYTPPEDVIDDMMKKVDLNGYEYVRIVLSDLTYAPLFEAWVRKRAQKMKINAKLGKNTYFTEFGPNAVKPDMIVEIVDYSYNKKVLDDFQHNLLISVGLSLPDVNHGGFLRLLLIDMFNKYPKVHAEATPDNRRYKQTVLRMCMEVGQARINQQWYLCGKSRQAHTDLVLLQGTEEMEYIQLKLASRRRKVSFLDLGL